MGTEIALIFGSAPCESWDFLAPYRETAVVFCADGGIRRAREAGFVPSYYVGDGDSGGQPEPGVEAVLLKPEKNFTDLQAAYELARDRGFRRMILTGCTGGRQDHHIANLQLLETAAAEGVQLRLLDPWNEISYLCCQAVTLDSGDFRYFSILPIDAVLEGVTITGAKYPLHRVSVRRGDSLTVSNEPMGSGPVTVEIEAGAAWLVRSERLGKNR